MTEAVAAMANISDYWVEADKNRALKRPSLGAIADDITYWSQLRQSTLNSIAKLKTWQAQEAIITHNPSR